MFWIGGVLEVEEAIHPNEMDRVGAFLLNKLVISAKHRWI